MDEPPIVPPKQEAAPPGERAESNAVSTQNDDNPFAPVRNVPPDQTGRLTVVLPVPYWVVLVAAFVAFGTLTFFRVELGVPALLALVATAIRVPLLLRRLAVARSAAELPNPMLLIATSWALMLAIGVASIVAFVVICVPAGALTLSVSSEESVGFFIVLGISGLIGLAVFVLLFFLTLRFPI